MTNTLVTPQDYAPPKYTNPMAGKNGGQPPDYSLHPKAQEAAAIFSDAMHELETARLESIDLRNELKVARAHIQELQHTLDQERSKKEAFQRYSVTMQTLIGSISRAAQAAADAAYDEAIKDEPKQVAAARSEVEAEVEQAIMGMKAAK